MVSQCIFAENCELTFPTELEKPKLGQLDMGSIFQAEESLLRVATSIGQQQSTAGYQVISEKRRLLGRSKPNSGSGSDKIFP